MPYGGSVSQLAGIDAAERQGAYARGQQMLNMLMAERARRLNAAQQQSQFDRTMSYREANDVLDRAERSREFDALQTYRNQSLRESERSRRQALLLGARSRAEANAQRELNTMLPQINAWAEEGGGSGPEVTEEGFREAFPKSMWGYSAMAVTQARKAREALKALYHADLADADALNREGAYRNMIEQERISSWNPDEAPAVRSYWMDRKNTPDAAAIAEWQTEVDRLSPVATDIRRDRDRIGRLVPDASGQYRAVAPSWMSQIPARDGNRNAAILNEAKRAIQNGKDPRAVRQRLLDMGITPDF